MNTAHLVALIELSDTLKSGGQIETELQHEALLHLLQFLPPKREFDCYQECYLAVHGTSDNKEAKRHYTKRLEAFEAKYPIFSSQKGL